MGRTCVPQRPARRNVKRAGKKQGQAKACLAHHGSLLPRLWAHFRPSADACSARLTQAQLRKWLAEEMSGAAKDTRYRDLHRSILTRSGARLKQKMGFRFKDPSPKGSWGVDNLQGFSQKALGPAGKHRIEFVWHDYMASFRLRTQGKSFWHLQRTLATQAVVARVEQFKESSEAFPLPQVMYTVTAKSRCNQAGDRRRHIKIKRRTVDLLPAVVIRPVLPAGPPQWTLIYLHGLGSSALGNYADRPHYFLDGSIPVKVVVPTAPSRELSCYPWWQKRKPSNGGPAQWHLQKFRAWYDYLTDNDGKREDELDLESLHEIRSAIHSIIEHEVFLLGGNARHVILGGKSQGCGTAVDAALTYPKPLGGVIGLVGHVLSCTPVDPGGVQAAVPMHFFHEPEDTIMQWHWVQATEQRLRNAGYNVHSRHCRDPEGRGHMIEGVEGRWIRSALRSICGRV